MSKIYVADYKAKLVREKIIVEVGSKWNYDRSLCHSPNTQNLTVFKVHGDHVSFEETMAYTAYGIEYFNDGKTFTPVIPASTYPASWLRLADDGKELVEGVDFELQYQAMVFPQREWIDIDEDVYNKLVVNQAEYRRIIALPAAQVDEGVKIEQKDLSENCIMFPIAVKKTWDVDAGCYVYVNEEYNISGHDLNEAQEMNKDELSAILEMAEAMFTQKCHYTIPQYRSGYHEGFIPGFISGFAASGASFQKEQAVEFWLTDIIRSNGSETNISKSARILKDYLFTSKKDKE